MKPGKQLESLVETLERVLVGNEHTKVIAPYHAPDRTTGKSRQHDVAVVMTNGHHETTTAIECRDRSRPIGVPQVEAFHQKCMDTGIARGVMVSPKGFYSTAATKAKHLGIGCLSLNEVESFDWVEPGAIRFFQRRIMHNQFSGIPVTPLDTKPQNIRFIAENGEELTREILLHNAKLGIDHLVGEHEFEPGEHSVRFLIQTPGCIIEDIDTEERYPMKHFVVTTTLEVSCTEVPVRQLEYCRDQDEEPVGRVAVASFDSDDFSGDLVFSRNADESTNVVLVPKKNRSNKTS